MDEEDTASSGERLERDGEAAEVNGACCMAEEESSEGEEGGGGESKGPKDHIKVKVLDYEKIGEEFSYTVQVMTAHAVTMAIVFIIYYGNRAGGGK